LSPKSLKGSTSGGFFVDWIATPVYKKYYA